MSPAPPPSTLFRKTVWCVLGAVLLGCAGSEPASPAVLIKLPAYCNTPDGCTLSESGDIILSIPNFNNKALLSAGAITAAAPPLMVKIDKNNKLTKWYEFASKDLHPETGTVGPMGCDFGPDGNLYVADNQLFENGEHKSRLLRIEVKGGKPVGCTPVVEGFIVSNAVIWKGDTVYVSETILAHPPKAAERPGPLRSGVYAIGIAEWKDGPVKLRPWSKDVADPHLIATFESNGSIGFGADGLTLDGAGNLYCSIFEEGTIHKITFDADGKARETSVFAKDEAMASSDGIFWNAADNRIYVADMLINAVQVVDMDGKVTLLHSNGDTTGADGSLDEPCEVIVRGNELIVINMDMPFPSDRLTNTAIDQPYTISVIRLK